MDIDELIMSNMVRLPFMPIEYEIERTLTNLGYTVKDLDEGLFRVEKGEDIMFYVYASSRFPYRFSLSMEAYVPPEVVDKDDFIFAATSVARKNGYPGIFTAMWKEKCYVSRNFKRRYNRISPARLQRNIDEFLAACQNFVLCEKLILETDRLLSCNDDGLPEKDAISE